MPPAAPANPETLNTRELLNVLLAAKKGNFTKRMAPDQTGVAGKIADALNDVLDLQERLCAELARVSNVVGKEGKTTEQAALAGAGGSWSNCVGSVNDLIQ